MNLSTPEKRNGNESVREPGKPLFVPAVEGVLNGRNVIILPLFLQFFADFPPFFFVCYLLFPCLLHVSTIVHLLFIYYLTIVITIVKQFLNNKFYIFVLGNRRVYTGKQGDMYRGEK